MQVSKLLLLCMTAALALPVEAQMSVSDPSWSGVEIQLEARIEPGGQKVGGAVLTNKGHFSRTLFDSKQGRYYGYDLFVEPRGAVFQVRIEPLSLSTSELAARQIVDSSWTPIPLVKYPVIPQVPAGAVVSIDLLQNPATGQKVVDVLTFKSTAPAPAVASGPPRDFSISDVEIRLESPRVSVNGQIVDASLQVGGSVSGQVLWFYLPERGRFAFSIQPNRDYRRAGEIFDKTMDFTVGGDQYHVQSAAPIAPGSGRFHLYVLDEPHWRPVGGSGSSMILGAAISADLLR